MLEIRLLACQDENGVNIILLWTDKKLRNLRIFGYGAFEAGQSTLSAYPFIIL